MRSLLLVFLFFAVTLSTFALFPMEPAVAQLFDFDTNVNQDNRCPFGTFVNCNLDSTISAFTDGIFLVGSATLHQTQLNECTGSENPAAPTLCANTANTELILSALDQAFIESNSEQLTEQTNTCIAGSSCENTGVLIGIDPVLRNEFISIMQKTKLL